MRQYVTEDGVDALVDVAVGVADDVTASLFQPGGAGVVVFDLAGVGVAVDLDDQAGGGAVEIDDEAVDRGLAAEFVAAQAPIAQVGPELELGGRLRVPEFARASEDGWVEAVAFRCHGFHPHPNPSPCQGEGRRCLVRAQCQF